MKKYTLFIIFAVIAATMCSCSSRKSPIKTFVMPCTDCVKSENSIRVWASGTSDSETSARKKAIVTASAELAERLSKTVETVTENYTSALNDGNEGKSKSFLSEKSKIAAKQVLEGASIICDEWVKDENGQYTNYIVLELKGNDFIKALLKEVNNEQKIDEELLKTLFMKNIQEMNK